MYSMIAQSSKTAWKGGFDGESTSIEQSNVCRERRRIRPREFLRQTTAYFGFKPLVPLHNSVTTHSFVVCGIFRIKPIHPNSPFMKKWDILSVGLMFFTAIVTPYETAFPDNSFNDAMFVVNRIVDMSFLFDMTLRFFLMYHDDWSNVWIAHPAQVVHLVSVIPFDLINVYLGSSAVRQLSLMRILRLLRLMKILRVIQGTDMFTRWEAKMSMNYATLALAKFGFIVLMISHWIACLFRFIVDIEYNVDENGAVYNWMTEHSMGLVPLAQMSPSTQYLAALYWSVMTLTTIGYGDVVPSTVAERTLAIICMLLGAGTYAYVVGGVCQILNSMDASTTEFHKTLDTLNEYAKENQLPVELTLRLREYFHSSRSLLRDKQHLDLLLTMSPGLRGEVAVYNNNWIYDITFFSCENLLEREQFVTALALVLRPECFPPNEFVIREGELNTKMYLVQRGLATKNKVVYAGGTYFGEDIILSLRQRSTAVRAFSYLHVQVLSKYDLEDIIATGLYPEVHSSIRRQVLKAAFKSHFVGTAKRLRRVSIEKSKSHCRPGPQIHNSPRVDRYTAFSNDMDKLAENLTKKLDEVSLRLSRLEKYLLPNISFEATTPSPHRRRSILRSGSSRRSSISSEDAWKQATTLMKLIATSMTIALNP
ncbi:voltage-gated ion channel superfamily [Thraustotheca clavata]|uniref:Voltage-gated ion channel superfamily n=1 Tax=Thraustotheca clavata TaxID=74557 RepID=A0A1W0A9S9_9STRA|nr:voltage-gated ion channel superfamily [Thraustotheca clavata]